MQFLKKLVLAVTICAGLTIQAGAQSLKGYCDWFSYTKNNPQPKGEGPVKVFLENGETISGMKYRHPNSKTLISSETFTIDEKKFKVTEVKGYEFEGLYYARTKRGFAQRFLTGTKISLYVLRTGRFNKGNHYDVCDFFYQRGDGVLEELTSQDDMRKILADCPETAAVINQTAKELRKAYKANNRLYNELFEKYNLCNK